MITYIRDQFTQIGSPVSPFREFGKMCYFFVFLLLLHLFSISFSIHKLFLFEHYYLHTKLYSLVLFGMHTTLRNLVP